MLEKIRQTVRKYRLLEIGDRVVAAVSGGPDSVCLLRILLLLASDYRLKIMVAHMNHGMRGEESDRDESFVRKIASDLDLPFETVKVDIPALLKAEGGSAEDVCRRQRYRFLERVSAEHAFTKIALGHHRDDQVETILMNLIRGSGPEGLKGFSPFREGRWIRPLFEITRDEIFAFLKSEKLDHIVDSTNESDLYLRNRLRRHLIPRIERDCNPRFSEGLLRMSDIVAVEDDYMQGVTEDLLRSWGIEPNGREMRVDIDSLLSCHPAVRRRAVKSMLVALTPEEKGIGYRHVLSVLELAEGDNPGGSLNLPLGIHIRREYGRLVLVRKDSEKEGGRTVCEKVHFSHDVEIPGILDAPLPGLKLRFELIDSSGEPTPELKNNSRAIFLDCDKITFPLTLRSIHPGDRIRLAGVGRKKISDVLIDAKVPRHERNRKALLVDAEGVLWIVGMRWSDRAEERGGARKILKAEII